MRRALLHALLVLAIVACKPSVPAPVTDMLATPGWGQAGAALELLAFVDPECPHSRAQAADLVAVQQQFAGALRVRVLWLPLAVHPQAVLGASAAVAAEEQHAFATFWQRWLRPDAQLSREAVVAWAVDAGLDAKRFATTLDAPQTRDRIARDVAIAVALGVRATPTLLLNGHRIVGRQTRENLAARVSQEQKELATLETAGAPRDKWLHARIVHNAPEIADTYARFVERAEPAPAQPVPLPVDATSASPVAAAQVRPAAVEPSFGGPRALLLPGSPTQADGTVWRVTVRPDDPQLGAPDARVTLVLFADLWSQEAQAALPWLTRLATHPDPPVRLVFKHLPRPVHPQSKVAALALEAAREQGKFAALWQSLVQGATPVAVDAWPGLARQAGLDVAAFQTSLVAKGGQARVESDVEQAEALGVAGFVALYVNGVRVPQLTEDAVQAAIQTARKQVATLPEVEARYDELTRHGKLLDALDPVAHTFTPDPAAQRGLPGAAVTIVILGDLQCPYTARLWPHLQRLETEWPGRLRIAWLDFPQPQIHPLAERLAELGQGARQQGKFWALVAALARRVDQLDEAQMWQAVREAGLKEPPLRRGLTQHTWTAAVQDERKQGEAAQVRGTPALFLDGHLFQPSSGISAETLRPAITRLLATH